MSTLHVAASADLSPALLNAFRTLLDEAFDGEFTDDDWAHTVGGIHIWITVADQPVSHAAVVTRTLVCGSDVLCAGYVEGVATAAACRRRGHGRAVMRRATDEIRARHALGALSTGEHGFYETLGWERWLGPTFVAGPHGRVPTPDDDDGVMILRTPRTPDLDLTGTIVCDWRTGDVW